MQKVAIFPIILLTAGILDAGQTASSATSEQGSTKRFVAFEYFNKNPAAPKSECLANYTPDSHPLYKRYHLLVLEYAAEVSVSDLDKLSQCLGSGWLNVPLEYDREGFLIPTNELLVSFKTGTRNQDIQKLLRANGLNIVQINILFTTVQTGRPIIKSQNILNKLIMSKLVKSAEINKIFVRLT